MKKVLFITNIPAPYRIDFYNELGKYVDLTVIFEAKGASNQGIKFNWNLDEISNFKAIFLSDGDISERKIDLRIFKYLKKNMYDEIFVTNYSYFTEMAALIYLKIKHISYYMETDGGIIKKEENKLKKYYKSFLVKGAKGYFSPSKSSDDYLNYYGADKEKIYRYPFTSLKDEDILKETLTNEQKKIYKERLGIKEEKVILGVGRFIYIKGWDILLKSISKLNKNIGVYIVGGTPTEEYEKIKRELNITNIHFEDFKTKEKLKEYFMAADLFVLPTRGDVWGLVINEAMGYGLPIITTNKCVAGIELIEQNKNGYIIKNEDVEDLHNKIIKILNDEKIYKFSENSLERIKGYTINEMVKAHLKILSNS